MANFAAQLAAAAAEQPEHPAVKLDEIVLSYGALDHAAARLAGLLSERGVGHGDRVGVQLPNVPYFPIAYFGALRLGATVVPMNPLLRAREVAQQLRDSGCRLMLGWHQLAESAGDGARQAGVDCVLVAPGEFERELGASPRHDEVLERAEEDPAVIIYTSGTTGAPKGATLTHANLLAGARVARELVAAGPDDVALAALPLFHVFGMNSIMNCAVHARALITLVPRFEPSRVLEVIERDRVTTFAGVPTMYAALLRCPGRERFDTSSLNLCVSGGAPLPAEVLHGFDQAFGAKVLEGYGLSESTGMGTFNTPDRERKPGSIGIPVGDTELRIVDEQDHEVRVGEPGELLMRGSFVMRGYWRRDEETAEVLRGGWLRTGDIARVDEDGYYWIVDRKKDLIIRGGYNVYPREVEEVLYEHPDVLEAAVLGVRDETLGEEVGAAVVLRAGARTTVEQLREYVKQRVAAYKYPRLIWTVAELPKGATGKILKRQIKVPRAAAGRG